MARLWQRLPPDYRGDGHLKLAGANICYVKFPGIGPFGLASKMRFGSADCVGLQNTMAVAQAGHNRCPSYLTRKPART